MESGLRYTAFLALAYVSGFIIVFLPSGLGAREALLVLVLVPDLSQRLRLGAEDARPLATLTVILLRLVWTSTELLVAAGVFWLPLGVRDQASAANGCGAGVNEPAESAAGPEP